MIQNNLPRSPIKSSIKNSIKSIISGKSGRIKLALSSIFGLGILAVGMVLINGISPQSLVASDHDDGETDTKGRNLNLTDLYVFREADQNPSASANDLVLVMNTNPRSVARQQYYFSSNARYEFRISRVAGASANDATPTGQTDVTLRMEFGAPDANQQQRVKLTALRDNQTLVAEHLVTTPLRNGSPIVNNVTLGGSNISLFAGLREDPFFFDVEQYFRVRAGALGIGPAVGFRDPSTAIDFAKGYNVNAIALRVPLRFIQGATNGSTFDVWMRVFVPDGKGDFVAVERLARPAINEGLVVTNDFLNTLNAVGPLFEALALRGTEPQASAAAPIVAEVKRTLIAFGNTEARANTLINAFLPDVMRIDTLNPSGYGNLLNAKGSPITGRLLKDDVIDTTLQVVTGSAAAADNVSYEGTPGNPAQGHKPLLTSFPYLAPAN
jgi:Domain of unknown function (DUF4331)